MNTENVSNTTSGSSLNYQKIFRYVAIGIVAVIVLALVISIIGALIPDKFETSGKNYIDITENDDGEYVLIFSGKKPVTLKEEISEKIEYVYDIETDYENKYAIVLVESEEEASDDEDESEPKKSSELYVITAKGEEVVAEDVESYMLSAYGDLLLYITYDGDLYVGEISKAAKAKKIDSDVSYINAVSPDGSAFAYTRVEEAKEDEEIEEEVFVSDNGKKGEKFDKKDSTVVAISDDAKYVYYVKMNDEGKTSFYVNDTKLTGEDDTLTSNFCFNRDGSQLIFTAKDKKDETKTYLVNKGKEKVTLEDGELSGILAPSGAYASTGYFPAYNVSSFTKCAVRIDDNYYYLKNTKGDTEKLGELKNASQIKMLDDGKTVVFIKNESLRTFDITKYNKAATEYESEDDILRFVCTSDGEHIYAVDDNDTLYYVKSKSSMKKVADDVSNARAVKGGKVYILNEDGELYLASKSGSPKKVEDDVLGFTYYEDANDFYAWTEDAYYSVSGKNAKKVFNVG